MAAINNCKDILMLLLYAKGQKGQPYEPIVGKTRLMKMVFLFDEEIRRSFNLNKVVPDSALPEFEAYNYGPYSAEVYSDLEFLVELGMIEVTSLDDTERLPEEIAEYEYWQATSNADEDEGVQTQEQFSLTALGRKFVEKKLLTALNKEQVSALDEFKRRCTAADLRTLLNYVYSKYPKMADRSKIRDKVLGHEY
jgi:uncharacterized protein YwgA